MLEYTGTDYEDKQMSCGPAPNFDKSCWFDNKFSFGLDFPNLPYYKDDDVAITQSNAILKHIAR
jgi:glutathione S-transferase